MNVDTRFYTSVALEKYSLEQLATHVTNGVGVVGVHDELVLVGGRERRTHVGVSTFDLSHPLISNV